MNRQKILLFVLLLLLVAAIFQAYQGSSRLDKVAGKAGTTPATVPSAEDFQTLRALGLRQLRVDLLEGKAGAYKGYKKDIFTLDQGQEALEETSDQLPDLLQGGEPLEPVAELTPETIAPLTVPTEFELLKKDLSQFTLLGYVIKSGRRTVFLQKQGEIFVVKQGDWFGEDYRVKELTKGWISITKGGNVNPIMIPLVEDSPLAPAALSEDGLL